MDYFPNKEITIEVTNRCGAKCVMCPRELLTQKLDVMKNDVFFKIVEESKLLGIQIIDLCGYGDVFLDRELFTKIKYAKKINPDFKVYISTTGNVMREKYFEDILQYVSILKFSIYGTSKNIYEKMMGGIKFEKSIKNILKFLKFDKDNKVYTMGNYILMDETKPGMNRWIDFWEKKLSEVYVWKPHNYIYGRSYRDISGQKKTSCGRPLEGPLNVAVDGKAHVCCFDFNKDIIVGDLNKQSIVDVLNSKELKHIQEKHKNNDFEDLLCNKCDQVVKDDSVLVYKSNKERVVGMSNSSLYVFKS
jgi:hypothetical protein